MRVKVIFGSKDAFVRAQWKEKGGEEIDPGDWQKAKKKVTKEKRAQGRDSCRESEGERSRAQEMMERSFTNKHRCKCKVIALIDLIWRVAEFFYSILELLAHKVEVLGLGSMGEGMQLGTILQKVGPHGIAMISPLLSFLYILSTILQVAVACIMFKACNGKVPCEQEEGACSIWMRMSSLSLVVAVILFVLPFVQWTLLAVSYFAGCVVFRLLGLLVVKIHVRNLERLLLGPPDDLPF